MDDGVTRYRATWRQVSPQLLPVVAWAFFLRSSPLAVLGIVAFGVAVVAGTRSYYGVDLGPDGLVLNGLRRRVIPWSRIGSVHVSRMLGATYVNVYTDGRTWMLRAPTHLPILAPDPGFDAKYQTILRTWEARRGPQWLPPMWQAPAPVAP